MSEDNVGIWNQMLAKRAEWAAEQPSLSAEIKAMGREGLKDIRATLHETYFGQPEHMSEPGSPLNPTAQMITQDLGTVYGSYQQELDSYAARAPHIEPQQEQER